MIQIIRSLHPLCVLILATLVQVTLSSNCYASCKSKESHTDQSLVFTIDVSSSLEANEMEIQLGAYQHALTNQDVQDKLLGCGCTEIAVAFFGNESRIVLESRNIVSEEDIQSIANFFSSLKTNTEPLSRVYNLGGQTYIDNALRISIDYLNSNKNTSFRKAILISGNGVNSVYAENELSALKEEADYHAIEVSALPIVVGDQQDLISYYPYVVEGHDFSQQRRSDGSVPSPVQEPVNGKTYKSLTQFFEQFVISKHGTVNSVYSVQDLKVVLTQSIKDIACKPMM